MFPRLAKQGDICFYNASATVFPSLVRTLVYVRPLSALLNMKHAPAKKIKNKLSAAFKLVEPAAWGSFLFWKL